MSAPHESVEPDYSDLSTLPDTNTRPVATAILLERLRLQRLWLAVESSTSAEYFRALSRFRRALGLEA